MCPADSHQTPRPAKFLSCLRLFLISLALLHLMLTGSMALYHYAQPRMTRDIDIVLALVLKDLETFPKIFGDEFYFSPEAAREAVFRQSYFNVIHNESLIK